MDEEQIVSLATQLVELEYYRYRRYRVDFSVVLIYSEIATLFELVAGQIRRTDIVQQVAHNVTCLAYTHTDITGAHTATQKLCEKLAGQLGDPTLRAGLSAVRPGDEEAEVLVIRALNALKESRSVTESGCNIRWA